MGVFALIIYEPLLYRNLTFKLHHYNVHSHSYTLHRDIG